MVNTRGDTVLGHLRRLAAAATARTLTDAELLGRFAADGDESAFAALVERHGRLVWGVCRRVLGGEQDAEDAFQATFLALASSAGAIRKGEAVANWLYGVARRVALCARRGETRRRVHEGRVAAMPRQKVTSAETWREIQAALDEEVGRLPERQRAAFVLCSLEGKSGAEAARELGVTEGAVAVALTRARKTLAARLSSRGIALSAALGALALSQGAAGAAVPVALAGSTVRLAKLLTAGGVGSVPSRVAELASTILGGVVMTKVKVGVGLVLAASLLACLAAVAQPVPAKPSTPAPDPAAAAKPGVSPAVPARLDRHGDPLPEGAMVRLGTLRMRMGGMIPAAVVSPGGKAVLAAGGPERALRLFDPKTGKSVQEYRAGPEAPSGFRSVAMSPDGKTVAAFSSDGKVVLWDGATVRQLGVFEGHGNSQQGSALAFSPDGATLAAAAGDGVIRLWEIDRNKAELPRAASRRLEGHRGAVAALAFTADGKRLVSGGADKSIRFWDLATDKELGAIVDHPSPVRTLAVSPDGKLVASGGEEDTVVHLWDAAARKQVHALRGHRYMVAAVAFSPDGKALASGGRGTEPVRLWDPVTGKELKPLEDKDGNHGGVFFVGFLSYRLLAAAGVDATVRLWDITSGKEAHPREGPQGPVVDLAVSPDGRFVAAAGWDRRVHLWELATGREARAFQEIPGTQARVGALAYSPDGKAVAGVASGAVFVWDPETGAEVRQLRPADRSEIACVAFGPGGKTLATGGYDKLVRLWDAGTGREIRSFAGHPSLVWRVAVSPDGKTIASLSGPRTANLVSSIRLWEADIGKELRQLEGAEDCHGRLTFSPDGRYVAAGASGDAVRLWEARTGRPVRTMRVTEQSFPWDNPVAFSPDGRELAIGGGLTDESVHVFEVATGGVRYHLRGHRGTVRALAFTPDGRRLVSGSADTTALVWDLTGELDPPRAAPPSTEELGRGLADLGDKDAARAYAGVRLLAASPVQALPLLKEQLRPVQPVDEAKVAKWVGELDSDMFAVREAATTALSKLGDAAAPALRKALAAATTAEARVRLERLLTPLGADTPARVRQARLLEAAERMRTAAARRFIEELAKGAPDTRLTEAAASALGRLDAAAGGR